MTRKTCGVVLGLSALLLTRPLGLLAATPAKPDDLAVLRQVIGQVVRAIRKDKRNFVFPREMRDIAWVQLRAGDISGALRTASAIPDRDYHWRDDVLVGASPAQAEKGNIRRAFQTARMIVEPAARVAALRLIAKEQARGGDKAGAFTTFRQALKAPAAIRDRMVRDLVLEDFAAAKAGAGDVKGALDMAASINDLRTRYEALTSIAVVQGKKADAAGAVRTIGAIEDLFLRAGALRKLAGVLLETGDKASAALLAEEALRTAAAGPNMMWFSENLLGIARMRAEGGDRQGAVKMLQRALQIAATLPDGPTKANAFLGIAETFAEIGEDSAAAANLARALRAAAAIQDGLDRDFVLVGVASAQIEKEHQHDALDIIGEAIQAALAVPDASKKRDDAFFSVARTQAKAGDMLGAIQTGMRAQDPLRRAHLFLEIAGGQLKAGGRVASLTLQEALQAASSIPDRHEKHLILQEAGCLQTKGGDVQAALQTVAAIQNASDRVFALVGIAVAQAEAGDRSAADGTLEQTERMAMAIPDKEEEKSAPVLAIAQGWVQIGGSNRAYAWAYGQRLSRLKMWALMGVAKGLAFRIIEPLEPDMVDRPLTLRAGYGC